MHPIQQLMSLSDPEQFYLLDENSIQQFNPYFFWKNTQGKYMGCNDAVAKMLGFAKGSDLLGYTDFDLCWADSAPHFRHNDNQVIASEKPIVAIESGRLIDGKQSTAFSHKFPLRLRSKRIVGVICTAIAFDNTLPMKELHESKTNSWQHALDSIANENKLTKRQKQCLYYLIKGMTIKEIAHQLTLSARTVEHYLETVKTKLNCHSRSQLIASVLDYA
jgi:DNA-binding CsgD family transcriptional regulator